MNKKGISFHPMLHLRWSILAPLLSMQNKQKNHYVYLAVWAEPPAPYYI